MTDTLLRRERPLNPKVTTVKKKKNREKKVNDTKSINQAKENESITAVEEGGIVHSLFPTEENRFLKTAATVEPPLMHDI